MQETLGKETIDIPRADQRVRAALIEQARGVLEAAHAQRPVKVAASAFVGCRNADESAWVRKGGNLEHYRILARGGDWRREHAEAALSAVEHACGVRLESR